MSNPTTTFQRVEALASALDRVLLWDHADPDLLGSLADYEHVQGRRFDPEEEIYQPAREALQAWRERHPQQH